MYGIEVIEACDRGWMHVCVTCSVLVAHCLLCCQTETETQTESVFSLGAVAQARKTGFLHQFYTSLVLVFTPV